MKLQSAVSRGQLPSTPKAESKLDAYLIGNVKALQRLIILSQVTNISVRHSQS
jgi:hypothetical protein